MTGVAAADPCEAALPQPGAEFGGPVTYIVDGDGLCVGETQGGIEIRLGDFDAPELREPGGREARDALAALTLGHTLTCVAGPRSYDRVVAWCRLDGAAIGDLMRAAGVIEGGR